MLGTGSRLAVVLVMSRKGEAVALAKVDMDNETILKDEIGIVAATKRVLMLEGTYPKGCTAKSEKGT